MLLTHGKSKTPEYIAWQSMKGRCLNEKDMVFKYYGARGIMVCERWTVFENFYADMGPRPEGHTLDRIDNEGHYEPGNCRWATWTEQSLNKRVYSNSKSGVTGVCWDKSRNKWRAQYKQEQVGRYTSIWIAAAAYQLRREEDTLCL